jgi:hypothetical protein
LPAQQLAPAHMTVGKPSIRQISGNMQEFQAEWLVAKYAEDF